MRVNPAALVLGLISAVALAFYAIYPANLIHEYGAVSITGWAMLIAGVASQFMHPSWKMDFTVTPVSITLAFGIFLFGTAIPFLFFLMSLKHIDPLIANIAGAMEPVLSAILSVFIFGLVLHGIDSFSIVLIVVSVVILSLND
jgi:drug/metabolite transporter (DMT)-like permease